MAFVLLSGTITKITVKRAKTHQLKNILCIYDDMHVYVWGKKIHYLLCERAVAFVHCPLSFIQFSFFLSDFIYYHYAVWPPVFILQFSFCIFRICWFSQFSINSPQINMGTLCFFFPIDCRKFMWNLINSFWNQIKFGFIASNSDMSRNFFFLNNAWNFLYLFMNNWKFVEKPQLTIRLYFPNKCWSFFLIISCWYEI